MERITKLDKFQIDDMYFGDIEYHSKHYQKILAFNSLIDEPFQKIWIKTPRLKMCNEINVQIKNKRSFQIFVAINTADKKERKFMEGMKKLEKNVHEKMKKITKNPKIKYKSVITKKQYPPIIKFNAMCEYDKGGDCYDFFFRVYNENNELSNVDDLFRFDYGKFFVELGEIYINNKITEYGFNWNILQMKYYPTVYFSSCQFNTKSKTKKMENSGECENVCYHCTYCPNAYRRTHICCNMNSGKMIPNPPKGNLPPPPILNTKIAPLRKLTDEKRKEIISKKKNNEVAHFTMTMDILNQVKLRPTNSRLIASDNNRQMSENFEKMCPPTQDELINMRNKLKSVNLSNNGDNSNKNYSFSEINKNSKKIKKIRENVIIDSKKYGNYENVNL